MLPAERELSLSVPTSDGVIPMDRIGCLRLPAPLDAVIHVWWLSQYAGGLLLPLRDGTAGQSSYGGGRYALDTAKGADLGGIGRQPGRRPELPISPVLPVQLCVAAPAGPAGEHHRRPGHRLGE